MSREAGLQANQYQGLWVIISFSVTTLTSSGNSIMQKGDTYESKIVIDNKKIFSYI
jgi:hypothetical protein